jgi:hypothetical protein
MNDKAMIGKISSILMGIVKKVDTYSIECEEIND